MLRSVKLLMCCCSGKTHTDNQGLGMQKKKSRMFDQQLQAGARCAELLREQERAAGS